MGLLLLVKNDPHGIDDFLRFRLRHEVISHYSKSLNYGNSKDFG